MTQPPNKIIGRYEIISAIGKGGMGEVYLANDKDLDRKVAIKFLSEEFSQDSDKLTRFIQEAKAASALNHPNILTVFEIGESENNRFIVTEHIEGQTISEVLDRKMLGINKAVDYAIQITSALEAAHEAGIIHRDIKASNVMVRKDGIVKLLDFGLAKLTYQAKGDGLNSEAPTLDSPLTVPGMLIGTPTYMSPEQARGKKLDVRTDIFSFGILFFEMLTGKRPFVGESYADIMGAILKDEPPPLHRFIDNVPSELDQILTKTLRKDRDKRYQNVKNLLLDLEDLRDNLKFEAKLSHATQDSKNNFIHSTDSIAQAPTIRIQTETRAVSKFPYKYLIAIIAGVFVLAFGIWWMVFRTASENSAPISLTKQEVVSWNSAPGELFSTGKFSPDGKMIAFASAKSGSRNIWIKQTVSGEAIQVTKDDLKNSNPIWSPNGSEIAFFSELANQVSNGENTTGIWRIPAFGGTPIFVTPVTDGGTQLRHWSKGGKIYYESNHNLFAVDVKTGKSEQITKFPTKDSSINSIVISPNEKQIAYVKNENNKWQLMVSPVSEGEAKQIVESETNIESVVWHPDNERLLYSGIINETLQVFVVSFARTNPNQLTFTEINSAVVDVSEDGSNILIGSAKEESNLWKIDLKTDEENTVASEIDSELWGNVSGEGEKIAYQSVKNLTQGNNLLKGGILAKDIESNSQTLKITDNGFLPIWSPVGQQIAFMRKDGETIQLWSIKNVGGREEQLTKGGIQTIGYSVSPYNRIQTSDFNWSPDGTRIAYISQRNGISNIWSIGSDGSNELLITNNKSENLLLYCPIWSSDGSKLAYSSKSTKPNAAGDFVSEVWVLETGSNEPKMVAELTSTIRLIGWSADESKLILATPSTFASLPPEVVLSEANIETGEQETLITLKDTYYYNIHLSNSRKKIAYVSHIEDKDDIWIFDTESKNAQMVTSNNDSNLYFSSLTWSPDGGAIYFGKQTRYSLLSMLTNFK